MTQLIYAVSALGIVAVMALSMQRSSNAGERSVYTNEVLTQLVTIGRDIVDEIAGQDLPFDEAVDPERLPSSATYPYVVDPAGLTLESEFGVDSGGCAAAGTCRDIDDFHYREGDDPITGTRNELEYSAYVTVRYVQLENANEAPTDFGGRSFAKEIVVTVESEAIQIEGEPISARYNRVITYPRITNFTY
jgi:hypothetical protein